MFSSASTKFAHNSYWNAFTEYQGDDTFDVQAFEDERKYQEVTSPPVPPPPEAAPAHLEPLDDSEIVGALLCTYTSIKRGILRLSHDFGNYAVSCRIQCMNEYIYEYMHK